MKKLCIIVTALVSFLSFPLSSVAAERAAITGILVPVSKERISVLTGDRAMLSLGEKDGVIKGDIGTVISDAFVGTDRVIGECAVIESERDHSVCELIRAKKEVEKGNLITFEPLAYSDAALYPVAVSLLSRTVQPYEPYRRVNLCVYGIFDEKGAVTDLSEYVKKELEAVFLQKKHVTVVDSSSKSDRSMSGLVFYPESTEKELLRLVDSRMKKENIDVLLTGTYTIDENMVRLSVRKIDRNGQDSSFLFSFPSKSEYGDMAARTILGKQPTTKEHAIECLVALKPTASPLQKNDKGELIRLESGGNPFIEQTMKRIDFDVISPVNVTVKVDDDTFAFDRIREQRLTLPEGAHRVAIAFKRGYFYSDSLMYTSEREVTKEAIVDISRVSNVVMEVRLDPLARDMITLDVYESGSKQKPVLRPIRKVTAERPVELFKD